MFLPLYKAAVALVALAGTIKTDADRRWYFLSNTSIYGGARRQTLTETIFNGFSPPTFNLI